jgi:hypothetical protein
MQQSSESSTVLAGLTPVNRVNGPGKRRMPLDDRGLAIPEELRRLEREARLTVWRSVSVAGQSHMQTYVVRGVESGGAIEQLGHYVTFAGEDGSPLEWLHPLDSIGANQTHAVVIAPCLTRIEVLRVYRTYELAISRHTISVVEDKPRLTSSMLFRGTQGFLGLELWNKDKTFRGEVLPTFYTRAGEEQPVPASFERAVKAAVEGACCLGCRDSHYLRAPSTTPPPTRPGVSV